MKPPAIILVKPQMGENIGAAARVMLNFGLDELRIVTPRDGWPNPKAQEMAAGAVSLVDNAAIFDTLEEAIVDIQYLLATTARLRDMDKSTVSVRECAEKLQKKTCSGQKCAIMFGPERSGLENDEVTLADSAVMIPVNPDYTSLNLAQAVAIVCYEWLMAQDVEVASPEERVQAPREDLIGLFEHLEDELNQSGFFKVPEKRPKMSENLRNIFLRAQMTDQEVRTLRGVIKSLVSKKP